MDVLWWVDFTARLQHANQRSARLGNVANNQPDGDEPAITDNGNYIVDLKSPASDLLVLNVGNEGIQNNYQNHPIPPFPSLPY